MKCPLCGSFACKHGPEDIGLTQGEFITYLVFSDPERRKGNREFEREFSLLEKKVSVAVRAARRKNPSSLAA